MALGAFVSEYNFQAELIYTFKVGAKVASKIDHTRGELRIGDAPLHSIAIPATRKLAADEPLDIFGGLVAPIRASQSNERGNELRI